MGCPAAPQLFLDLDDGLRAREPPRQSGIFALGRGKFSCQRVEDGGLAATLARNQGCEGSGVTLPAPISQGRGIQAFATQDGADPTDVTGTVGLGQDAQLVLNSEGPTPGAIGDFR
jgi:hypothetical protein